MNAIKQYLPVTLATLAILATVSLTVSANSSTPSAESRPFGRHEMKMGPNAEALTALESGDYNAWVKAESANGALPEHLKAVTPEHFTQFASMHQLMKAGKTEEAKAIADQLGLRPMGMGMRQGGQPNPEAQAALEAGDYNAWVKAESANGVLPERLKAVTQENFATFAEAHKLRKQGGELMQKADELLKGIGIEHQPRFGKGAHGRMGGFRGNVDEK